jgi:tetratricopeptide (TPR) repeat protein
MKSFKERVTISRWWPCVIIGLLVTLVYLPSFSGGFILDDHALIKNNPYIREPHSLISYFSQEDGIVQSENRPEEHTGYYRPLANLTYRMDYRLWGMKPQGFRATNFVLHLLTSLFLYGFVLLLVNNRQAALWASLFFAVHPVSTEAVSWVSGRNNILVALFFLLSFHFYVKRWEGAGSLSFVASVLFFAVAVLSKEFGLLVLPCIFLYHRFLSRRKGSFREEIVSYLPFLLLGIGYFVLRKMVTGGWLTPSEPGNLWERIYFSPYLIAWNLKLIFLPYNLHNFIAHYPSNYLNWRVFTGFSCVALLSILAWKWRKNRALSFSVLSFCAALFPVLNIVQLSAVTLVSMRWLYVPMIFVSLGVTQAIKKPMKINPIFTMSILCSIILYLGTYSYVLNRCLWKDEASFFRQEVVRFDNFFHAGGMAEHLLDKKDFLNAERYFQIAVKKYPKMSKNYINYSALLLNTNRPRAAISLLNEAESLPMTSKERGEWYNNTGTAYFHLMEYEEAVRYFKEAVDFWPGEFQFWSNLGAGYGSLGDYTNSASALERGLNLASDSAQIRKDLAVVYCRMGHPARAVSVLEKISHEELGEIGAKELLDKAREEGSKGCENAGDVER